MLNLLEKKSASKKADILCESYDQTLLIIPWKIMSFVKKSGLTEYQLHAHFLVEIMEVVSFLQKRIKP